MKYGFWIFLAGASLGSFLTYSFMKRKEDEELIVVRPNRKKRDHKEEKEEPTERKYQERDEHFAEREVPTDEDDGEEESEEEGVDKDIPFLTELSPDGVEGGVEDIFEFLDPFDVSEDARMEIDQESYYLTLPTLDLKDEYGNEVEIRDILDEETTNKVLSLASEYLQAARDHDLLQTKDCCMVRNNVLLVDYIFQFDYIEEGVD